MRHHATAGIAVATLAVAASVARAQPPGDATPAPEPPPACEYVRGVADADAALLFAPEVFASFGYLDQPALIDSPSQSTDDVRLTLGVNLSLGDVWEGVVTRRRAGAECRRLRALDQVEGETSYRALAARAAVLDEAMGRADELLADAKADLAARRATAQEVTATRVRVDALRALAADTKRALAALPPPVDGTRAGALAAYHRADADVERAEASLRGARAWDVSLRVGYDEFLGTSDETPFFAAVTARFDLGWFFVNKANDRAAAARKRMVERGGSRQEIATTTRLRALLELETQREAETAALAGDLDRQLDQLAKLSGEASRRLREVLWFEWVEAKAANAYHAAQVADLREILGEAAP